MKNYKYIDWAIFIFGLAGNVAYYFIPCERRIINRVLLKLLINLANLLLLTPIILTMLIAKKIDRETAKELFGYFLIQCSILWMVW